MSGDTSAAIPKKEEQRDACGEGERSGIEIQKGINNSADNSAVPLEDPEASSPKVPEEEERLEPVWESLSILAHLAVFAILGVCIRYGLELLWGPQCLHVTDDDSALFLDVPPNMFGSFLMGIVGYVSKKDIATYSQPLAIGLSTGLCGSITTFASWNQRMMSILAYGYVARALAGYLVGTAVAYYSFLVGVDAAHAISGFISRHNSRQKERAKPQWVCKPEDFNRRWGSLVLFVVLTFLLWTGAAVALALESSPPNLRKVALACILGPFGCWLRWYLSRLNGEGVGKERKWKWVPVGTLSANLIAVATEAAISAVDAAHNTQTGSLIVGGLQVGFMGCLSTVSTLIQEVYILVHNKSGKWKAYVYLYLMSFLPSIVLGILFYCVPVWVLNVASNGYNKADPSEQAYVAKVMPST